jgi:hypothetical protein
MSSSLALTCPAPDPISIGFLAGDTTLLPDRGRRIP